MEGHLVDAVPEAVERPQLGGVPVRLHPPADRLGAAREPAEGVQLVHPRPAAALAGHGLAQHGVRAVHVVPLERRRLVDHVVRRGGPDGHG